MNTVDRSVFICKRIIAKLHVCHYVWLVQATAREGTTQFITSTFYPECVKVAAQCYGVYCKNKVSHINELTNEQALGFIRDKDEDDPEEEIVP